MAHDRESRKKNKHNLAITLKRKWRRYEHLRSEARKLGKVKLDEPIRHGWKRKFILNEQTKNRNDANIIQNILDKVNNEYWSRERDWSKIKLDWKHMPDIDGCQLNPLTDKEYNKLSVREKKFFVKSRLQSIYWGNANSSFKDYWIIEKPHMYFKMKDRKYWLTEVPVFDPELDKEMEEIWDWIHGNGLYGKLANISGWRQNFNDPWDVRKKSLIENMSKKEMREYFNDRIDEQKELDDYLERFNIENMVF